MCIDVKSALDAVNVPPTSLGLSTLLRDLHIKAELSNIDP